MLKKKKNCLKSLLTLNAQNHTHLICLCITSAGEGSNSTGTKNKAEFVKTEVKCGKNLERTRQIYCLVFRPSSQHTFHNVLHIQAEVCGRLAPHACLCHVFLKLDSIIISTQQTCIVPCTPMRVSSVWLSRGSVHLLCCGAAVNAPVCSPTAWWVQLPLHLADMLHVLFPSLACHVVMGILTFSCKIGHLRHFRHGLSAHPPNGSTFSHTAGFIISQNRTMS